MITNDNALKCLSCVKVVGLILTNPTPNNPTNDCYRWLCGYPRTQNYVLQQWLMFNNESRTMTTVQSQQWLESHAIPVSEEIRMWDGNEPTWNCNPNIEAVLVPCVTVRLCGVERSTRVGSHGMYVQETRKLAWVIGVYKSRLRRSARERC